MARENRETLKVLLVDDDPFFLRFLTHFFARKEYQVATVSNGEEALEDARRFRPDLIVLDLEMPTLDGVETCNILKADESTREIPVVILTATEN